MDIKSAPGGTLFIVAISQPAAD